ncbi:MAG: hypothetical protein J0J06_13650 [Sphingomonas sp.]|uniref:hypothetical protein n=1 Tax=Sphingomonas sp. TaxID=28214 RepID=UPI001AD254E4|nr:hypothetical protein [Sphingomonas sp.]MBN8816478.1 hypothetical protein [Sphingomonas sp.]
MEDFFSANFATFVSAAMTLFGIALLGASVEDALFRRRAARDADVSPEDRTSI